MALNIVSVDTPAQIQRRSCGTDDAIFMERREGSHSQEDDEFECDNHYVEKVEEFYAKFVGGSQRHFSKRSSLRASFVSVASSVTLSDFEEDLSCASPQKASRHPSISSSIDVSDDSTPTLPKRRTSHTHHDINTCGREGCDRTPTKPGRRTSFQCDCGPRRPGRRTSLRSDGDTKEEANATDNLTAAPPESPVTNLSVSLHIDPAVTDDTHPARKKHVHAALDSTETGLMGSCDVSCSSEISNAIMLQEYSHHRYPSEAPSVTSRGA